MSGRDGLTRRGLLGRAAGAGAASLIAPQAGFAAALVPRDRLFSSWIGSVSGESIPIAAARRFTLTGIEWQEPAQARIELRARSLDGRWSPWVSASSRHDGDGSESDSRALFGEPIWTGPADAVQLRTTTSVNGVRVHFVSARTPGVGAVADAVSALPLAAPVYDAGPGQPAIIARRAWAGDAGVGAYDTYGAVGDGAGITPTYGAVKMAFVHHSDNPNGYSAADVPSMIYSIYLFHRYTRGWGDIGYNFVIDAFGRIWEARAGGIDQAVIGAHAGGYNSESTGAVILGTFTSVLPTDAAIDAMQRLLAWKLALHGVPTVGNVTVEVLPGLAYYTAFAPDALVSLPRVAGHRDGCTTDCPGDALYDHLPVMRPVIESLARQTAAITLSLNSGRLTPAADLSLAGTQIRPGESIGLSGRLTRLDGSPIAAAPVQVQSLSNGVDFAAVERTLVQAVTASDGTWSATLTATSSLLVRAVHPRAPATTSPLVTVSVARRSPAAAWQLQAKPKLAPGRYVL